MRIRVINIQMIDYNCIQTNSAGILLLDFLKIILKISGIRVGIRKLIRNLIIDEVLIKLRLSKKPQGE